MTTIELERRVAALEKQMQSLTTQIPLATNKNWLLNIWESFAGDSDFDKATDYGKKWRQAENRKSLKGAKPPAKKRRK